jgi:sigma-E factor negative regulatory protein RseA
MSEQIREQVSAFLDGELPGSETELLLKRLTRDAELRESFGRYALIGESMRGGSHARASRAFTSRVNRAIDGGPATVDSPSVRARSPRWWRPFAGAAVAAGVATVAVVALQQRAVMPTVRSVAPVSAQNVAVAKPTEALSYTVPASVPDAPGAAAPAALPAARLTNYVFAHSRYSSVLGQSNVLSGLLAEGDAADAGAVDTPAAGDAASDAAVARARAQSRDARVAP